MANFGPASDEDIFSEGGEDELDTQAAEEEETTDTSESEDTTETQKDEEVKEEASVEEEKQEEDDNPAKDAPKGYVPHAALHQQREINKELQAALDAANQRLGMVDGLKQQLDELRKAGQTSDDKDPAPDKEKDPMGYLEWENRQLKRDVESIKAERNTEKQSTEQQSAQQKNIQEFMTTVSTKVNEYANVQTDYPQAFMYAMEKRMTEYEAMGIVNPQEKARMFDQEVMQVAATALKNRINPGEAMYKLAKSWGYAVQKQDDGKGKDDKSIQEQLDQLEKGKKAGSMAGGRSSPPEGELSVEEILKLPDDEFDREWAKRFGTNSIHE